MKGVDDVCVCEGAHMRVGKQRPPGAFIYAHSSLLAAGNAQGEMKQT